MTDFNGMFLRVTPPSIGSQTTNAVSAIGYVSDSSEIDWPRRTCHSLLRYSPNAPTTRRSSLDEGFRMVTPYLGWRAEAQEIVAPTRRVTKRVFRISVPVAASA